MKPKRPEWAFYEWFDRNQDAIGEQIKEAVVKALSGCNELEDVKLASVTVEIEGLVESGYHRYHGFSLYIESQP